MFKRKELAEIPNVKPIAAETKKQRAKEGKQRSKQLRRSAKQSEMNAAQSARSIKKRRAPEKAADCLQYERMYESGICEVEPGLFSMTMAFTDVNFQLARQEEQKSLFTQYSEFLNYFDPDTHLQISLVTRRVDEAEFRRDTFLPLRGDARDRYSEEMNRVISEKALQGQNGLIREKYITISLHEDDYRKAQVRLLKRAEDIQNLFKRMGSTVRRLSGIERLNLLHGITRPEEVMAFSYDWLLAEDSLTTKDFIAPSGYNWKPEHDDSRAVYNDRYQFGEYYGKVLYLRDIAPQMKDNLLSLLSDLDFDNAISIHVDTSDDERLFKQLNYFSPPLLLLFFVRSGLNFDLGAIFSSSDHIGSASLLAVGVVYFVTRILGKYSGAFLGCLLAGKNKKVRNNLGLALIPQAGVAIGLAAMGARTLGGAMGDALETIILASSVLYELIGPACAKLSLYLSGSYSNRLDDIVTETVKCDEHEPENEVERLIRQIQAIQKELPAHNDPFLEDEQAYDEAAYEHYALTGYPQVSYQNTRRKADIWTL